MATQLSIVNGALHEVGEKSVSNVNDTDHATIFDQKVDITYREALSDTNWTFAQRFVALAKTTDPGIPNLPFVYQLPFDLELFVNVDRITNYSILGDKLYTDRAQDVNIFYVSNQTPFDLWPTTFERYIIFKLAAEASLVFTNNIKLTENLIELRNEFQNKAIDDNASREAYRERVTNKYDRRVQVI